MELPGPLSPAACVVGGACLPTLSQSANPPTDFRTSLWTNCKIVFSNSNESSSVLWFGDADARAPVCYSCIVPWDRGGEGLARKRHMASGEKLSSRGFA